MYKVLKKDGTIEDFSWEKISDGIIKSSGTKEEAEQVAGAVELWLASAVDAGVIKSYDLHVKVISVLNEVNPEVAKRYEEFKKPESQ